MNFSIDTVMNRHEDSRSSAKLSHYLAAEPLRAKTRKRLFGKPYICYGDLLDVSCFLYETAAILGRARRHRLRILTKMLVSYPSLENVENLMREMQKDATGRLERYKARSGKEPEDFYSFIKDGELAQIGLGSSSPGRKLRKTLKRKHHLTGDTLHSVSLNVLGGIGFGRYFPEHTVTMYRNRQFRNRACVSYEIREEQILNQIAPFIQKYFPDLVQPLDLTLDAKRIVHVHNILKE